MSNKFAAKDISNGSLNQITTTGFYFGSNITEVTPYIKSHKWCLINAFVSDKSASIFVTAGDAMALSIYRNGDGIYSYYPIATKSDLTALTDIILTPANSYSFSADFTYGYKRAGWVEIQFSLASAFDLNKNRILSIPNGCLPKKQVWFPVYESSGGNVIARGYIVGSNIYINGSNSINGKTKLFGHVVYMSES